MGATTAIESLCGAKTRAGHACRKPAGWHTPHLGYGRCAHHGGCTPDHVRKWAKEMAMAEAVKFGAEIDEDPLTSIVKTVRLSAGYREALRARVEGLEEDTATAEHPEVIAYGAWLVQHQRIVKMAVDAGVSERLVNLAERYGEQLAAVFEDVMAAVPDLTDEQRLAMADAAGAAIGRLEGGDIIEGSEA